MNTKKILMGGIAGGIGYFLLGYLIYGMLLSGMMAAHPGSVNNEMKGSSEMDFLPLIVGCFARGFLLALIINMGPTNFSKGIMIGGTVGFLMSLGADGITLGTTNIMSHMGAVIDIVAFTIMSAIVGGIVGWVSGMDDNKMATA